MTKPLTDLLYRFFNLIYKNNFSVYKWLYFRYKHFMDKHEVELMKKIIKPGMVVVDVGANIGFYTLLMADLVGEKGVVYAFEPERNNYNHLKELCRHRRNIMVNRCAVGEKSEELNLYISDDLNVDHLAYNDGGRRRREKVLSISLDEYFEDVRKIDFVKIDTQGYEHHVLKGMTKLITKRSKIIIMAEFSAYDLSLAGTKPEEHIRLVKRLNLKTYVLGKKFAFSDGGDLLSKNPNRAVYYNLLYLKGNQSINF